MKAIVNTIDLKAVEPGLHARSAKPGLGALFDPLFSMTNTALTDAANPVDEDVALALADDPQGAVGSWPHEGEAGRTNPFAGILDAQFADIAVVATETAPSTLMVADHALMTDHLVVETLPLPGQIDPQQIAVPTLMVPGQLTGEEQLAEALAQSQNLVAQMPQIVDAQVGQAGTAHADPALATSEQAAAGLAVAVPGLPMDATLPPVEDAAHANLLAPRARGDLPAPMQQEALQAGKARAFTALGNVAEAGEAAIDPLPPALLPLDTAETLPSKAEAAAKMVDRALTPSEVPPRNATPDLATPQDAPVEAQAKTPILASLIAEQKKPAVERGAKSPLDPLIMMNVNNDSPSEPAANAVAATRPDPMMISVAGQQAKIITRDPRLSEAGGDKSVGEISRRVGATMLDLAHSAPERSEPVAASNAAARPASVTQPVLPPAPVAMAPAATLNLRQADWGKQLVGHIERMVSNGSQRIELSLRPKNLGEIRVMLDLRGEQTLVHIVTETTAAARLLSGAEDRLAQALDQSGYRLSGFSAQEQGAGAQSGQQGQHAPRRNRSALENANREEPSETATGGAYSADRKQSTGINMLA
ncbi:flagellar hook-length control protein FliK [Roseicyclus sp.]|uniref:flagellar hook-length control protein FliK n=1 Tax=Roseicyclus sp. TaxID=1914329 RepID=UPI001BCB0201|nr:flagellar hook-length control protein FliK [Roseicyclus sp.]